MKRKQIRPEFVDFMPDAIKEGILYISIPYATATHKCPCGCGEIVVTPIRPNQWNLMWNGDAVTLRPSIGNWSLQCQSHYWITENKIVWERKLKTTRNARRKDGLESSRKFT
jgi:Family of unknown function (DUF6527)